MKIVQVITDYLKSTILTSKGDIIMHDGVSAKKFPIGAARRIARVNAAGDALEYYPPSMIMYMLTTKGDLLKHGGIEAERFPRGSAGQIIRVNAVPDDLEYQNPGDHMFEVVNNSSNVGNVNLVSTFVTVLTVDLGNVIAGSMYNISALIEVENYNAQTWCFVKWEKDSGTATPKFCYNFDFLDFQTQIEPSQWHTFNMSTLLRIATPGTLQLKITGAGINGNLRVPAGKCKQATHLFR